MQPLNASLYKQNDILHKIATLLTGQKNCDAAALAVSAGNVRLATVIIQVSVLNHASCVYHSGKRIQGQAFVLLLLSKPHHKSRH